jgi:alginate O-acetyltransferase complex protein AlgI
MSATIGFYWLLPPALRALWLIIATLAFLLVFDIRSVFILSAYAALLWYLARPQRPHGRVFLGAGIAVIAILLFYKWQFRGQLSNPVMDVGIPLGLSYVAFRVLHLIVELYRKTIPPQKSFAIISYVFFLPTIVVGPINRAGPFFGDRKRDRLDLSWFSEGIERIIYGYVKIAFLGNYLVSGRLGGYAQTLEPGFVRQYLRLLAAMFNLYFQFSGFSDVAIGFSLVLGYRVMENFNWPFLQPNIASFWRCWHISLTSWSRDYIYMPLIGIYRNPLLASISAFAFIGLWHDISVQYLLWGLYNAAGVIVWQNWQQVKRKYKLPAKTAFVPPAVFKVVSILLTLHFFMASFIIVS